MMGLRKWLVTLVLGGVLMGCGTKFLYNNLDWVILEYIDDYVTLTRDQKTILESRLQVLTQWHRSSELPSYISQIQSIRSKRKSDLDQEFVLSQRQEITQHIKNIAAQIAPDVYAFALQATPKQEQEFIENFTSDQQEYLEKYSGLSDTETRQLYKERIESNVERWLGSVSTEQEVLIREWANGMEITTTDWGLYQEKVLSTLEQLFQNKANTSYFQHSFMTLFLEPESFYSSALAQKIQFNKQLSSNYIVQIISTSNEEQWQHYQEELKEIEDLLTDLL
ncbi:DUF6279 family lipoprotein [Vibrio makurazakiensis]|uniref:DUF6279 family lipoprotein n=1 Tax=Vibrio makurazakiensis TaxID=2910250 RepID=UPI003D0F0620